MAYIIEVNYEDYQNNVIVEDITPNLPSEILSMNKNCYYIISELICSTSNIPSYFNL